MMTFTDPYESATDHCCVHTELDSQAYLFLKAIRPTKGTMKITLNLLVQKLIYDLKQSGITDYTRLDDFERFIVQRCTTPVFTVDGEQETTARDERRRTQGVCAQSEANEADAKGNPHERETPATSKRGKRGSA